MKSYLRIIFGLLLFCFFVAVSTDLYAATVTKKKAAIQKKAITQEKAIIQEKAVAQEEAITQEKAVTQEKAIAQEEAVIQEKAVVQEEAVSQVIKVSGKVTVVDLKKSEVVINQLKDKDKQIFEDVTVSLGDSSVIEKANENGFTFIKLPELVVGSEAMAEYITKDGKNMVIRIWVEK